MYVKILICFVLILASTKIYSKPNDTIPFIIYKPYQIESNSASIPFTQTNHIPKQSNATMGLAYQKEQQLVSTDSIITFIRKIRNTMCKSTGPADIKVWVSYDADGKILGIGVEGQSGVEITFHCR